MRARSSSRQARPPTPCPTAAYRERLRRSRSPSRWRSRDLLRRLSRSSRSLSRRSRSLSLSLSRRSCGGVGRGLRAVMGRGSPRPLPAARVPSSPRAAHRSTRPPGSSPRRRGPCARAHRVAHRRCWPRLQALMVQGVGVGCAWRGVGTGRVKLAGELAALAIFLSRAHATLHHPSPPTQRQRALSGPARRAGRLAMRRDGRRPGAPAGRQAARAAPSVVDEHGGAACPAR